MLTIRTSHMAGATITLQGLAGIVKEKGIDWAKWHVFWADERVVKLTDPDSNYKLAMVRAFTPQHCCVLFVHQILIMEKGGSASHVWINQFW